MWYLVVALLVVPIFIYKDRIYKFILFVNQVRGIYQRMDFSKLEHKNPEYSLVNRNVAQIKFKHNGVDQLLLLPHYPGKFINIKVVMVDKNDKEIEITHPGGIPYFLSPNMLGAKKVIVTNQNNESAEFCGSETIAPHPDFGAE